MHMHMHMCMHMCTSYAPSASALHGPIPRSDAWNEDPDDSSGERLDHLATGTKQKRAAQPEEQQEDPSAYERQRTANVLLNRGMLEGLGLADSALSRGRKAKAPAKKRARLEEP